MIDALFWYTGLIVWVLIVLGIASMLAVEAHDRSVMTKRRPMRRRWEGDRTLPVHMIKLNQEREITLYVWVHPGEDR